MLKLTNNTGKIEKKQKAIEIARIKVIKICRGNLYNLKDRVLLYYILKRAKKIYILQLCVLILLKIAHDNYFHTRRKKMSDILRDITFIGYQKQINLYAANCLQY